MHQLLYAFQGSVEVAGAGSRVRVVLVPSLMREMIMGAMRWPINEPVRPMGRTYLKPLAMLCGEWIQSEARLALPTSTDPRLRKVKPAASISR
jgi:hypothetical protein